jgi:proline iminopeptidase
VKLTQLLLPALWLCAACHAPQPEPATVPKGALPQAPSGYVAGADGVRLFYRVEGHGPDTVVVLHGGPGLNLEGLRPDLRPLERRHTLIYFDQRGSGHSDMPDTLRLTAALMVDDVEAVRRAFHLSGLTLFGHSWGGGLAVLYAARYPDQVRRMVLVGPLPPVPDPYLQQYVARAKARLSSAEITRQAQMDSVQKVAPDPYPACHESNRIFLREVAASPASADRIKGDLCAATSTNLRLMGVLNRQVWTSISKSEDSLSYNWRPMAARVKVPTLIVHGDQDPLPLAGSEEWVRALPAARLVVIEDAGHYPHAEQPDSFTPAVENFLSGH